jgi:hypothetical protein
MDLFISGTLYYFNDVSILFDLLFEILRACKEVESLKAETACGSRKQLGLGKEIHEF